MKLKIPSVLIFITRTIDIDTVIGVKKDLRDGSRIKKCSVVEWGHLGPFAPGVDISTPRYQILYHLQEQLK